MTTEDFREYLHEYVRFSDIIEDMKDNTNNADSQNRLQSVLDLLDEIYTQMDKVEENEGITI